MKNNKHLHDYNGYSVSHLRISHPWFAANLLLTRGAAPSAEPVSYEFHALDYLESETQAVGHATAWARDGVDSRG
jgi:hypothetical protein